MKSANPTRPEELMFLAVAEPRWNAAFDRQIQALRPGGVLVAGALPASPDSTREFLCKVTQRLGATPILAIQEEGGSENPLADVLPPLPSPGVIAENGVAVVRQFGELIGEALRCLGFNTNLAPLLDLATPLTGKTLGAQPFGSNPDQVAELGGAFVRGLQSRGILACGKHFPGRGSVPPAIGRDLAQSGKPMAGLWRDDLLPFRSNLPHLPMVLLSSAAYKAYDFDYPRAAALSTQVVKGLLRAKIGYDGLALAHHLDRPEVRGVLSLGDAAVRAIEVGCDILIIEKEESWAPIRQALAKAVDSSKLSPERVDQALTRIREVKKGCAPPLAPFARRVWDRLEKRFDEFTGG